MFAIANLRHACMFISAIIDWNIEHWNPATVYWNRLENLINNLCDYIYLNMQPVNRFALNKNMIIWLMDLVTSTLAVRIELIKQQIFVSGILITNNIRNMQVTCKNCCYLMYYTVFHIEFEPSICELRLRLLE